MIVSKRFIVLVSISLSHGISEELASYLHFTTTSQAIEDSCNHSILQRKNMTSGGTKGLAHNCRVVEPVETL